MGYPETAEGFMINSIKEWSKFTKQEVIFVNAHFSKENHTDNLLHPVQA